MQYWRTSTGNSLDSEIVRSDISSNVFDDTPMCYLYLKLTVNLSLEMLALYKTLYVCIPSIPEGLACSWYSILLPQPATKGSLFGFRDCDCFPSAALLREVKADWRKSLMRVLTYLQCPPLQTLHIFLTLLKHPHFQCSLLFSHH